MRYLHTLDPREAVDVVRDSNPVPGDDDMENAKE